MVKFYNKNYFFNKYFLQLNYFLIILFINYNNSSFIQENSENVQIKGEWCPDGCSCTTESPTTVGKINFLLTKKIYFFF